jgi:glutamate-1-semialdehyde 2,1-aminomutase
LKVVAIVQARMGSTRFPDKVMRRIGAVPMIGLLLQRLARATRVQQIVLATSRDPRNAALAAYVRELGYEVHQGSENDVLERYYGAAAQAGADAVVRITGDCPLIDPALVDEVIAGFMASGVDYASNTLLPTYPDGLDVEVFSFEALAIAMRDARALHDREHVTPYIRQTDRFRKLNCPHSADRSAERWTVDEPEDFQVIEAVFAHFHPRTDFSWQEVLDLQRVQPALFAANLHLMRNEGASMGTGQKLWRRAKRVIPGGSMLLSKRAEMFLPEGWPAYFSKAKGCRVWDLDGRELIDMSLMGIGTNTLGYGHPQIDEAVHKTVEAGNVSTLNCPEEVHLAERLVELHPWADMVRFARSGGEANAIAIRIARAAAGREKVAFCGYHGWHDWYLAANLGDEKNLAGHLLPGLEPNGVPTSLRNTIYPFTHNKFDELQALVDAHDIGVIKMEVSRNQPPDAGYLEKVRALADAKRIVLIFDECTSGFRQTFGGLHKLYGVDPDVAVFGKALGNGYAITAILGRREIMEAAQTSFISSTFWTERIGPTAALKTLEIMEECKSWETITQTGNQIKRRWLELAARHGLELELSGIPALAGFTIRSTTALAYKTLITQDMLEAGFLASTSVYSCIAHTSDVVNAYFAELDKVFARIRECEDGRNVYDLLKGPVCHSGFKRLN